MTEIKPTERPVSLNRALPDRLAVIGRLMNRNLPELSDPAQQYMHRSHSHIIDAIAASSDDSIIGPGNEIINDPKSVLEGPYGHNLLLASWILLDIKHTATDTIKNGSADIDTIEARRRSKIGEIMTKGRIYERFSIYHGTNPLVEDGFPYSPKLTALGVFVGVQNFFDVRQMSHYKLLVRMIERQPHTSRSAINSNV